MNIEKIKIKIIGSDNISKTAEQKIWSDFFDIMLIKNEPVNLKVEAKQEERENK